MMKETNSPTITVIRPMSERCRWVSSTTDAVEVRERMTAVLMGQSRDTSE